MANITKNDLHALYLKILPYLNQQSAAGGHTIENSSGTDLTDRDTLKFGGDLEASDDSTNEKTVVEPHELTNAEIAEIFSELPITPASNYMPNTGFTPVGTIISVMGNHAPSHYLACDGTEYYVSDYPVLAKYFEDEFGTKNHFGGNGTTTFAVPDLQGEFLRGAGTNSHENQGSGANVGTHQDGTVLKDNYGVSNAMWVAVGVNGEISNADKINMSSTTLVKATSSGTSNYGNTFTARPTNTSVLYCIAVQNIYIDAKYDYSTDEKVVGTWIDGRPIYQKSIEISSNFNVAFNISNNIDVIIDWKGVGIKSSDIISILPYVPYTNSITTYYNYCASGYPTNSAKQWQPQLGSLFIADTIKIIYTFKYTKTTD